MTYTNLLKKVEAFQNLTNEQLKQFQTCCEEVIFKKNDRLFAEGEPSHHVWILAEGKVDLRFESDENTRAFEPEDIHFVSEVNLFGWSCFVPPYQYYLTGYCDSETCRILRIKKEDLVSLFEKDERIGHVIMSYVLKVVGTHFQQLRDKLAARQTQFIQPVNEISKNKKKIISTKAKTQDKKNQDLEDIAKNLIKLGKLTKQEIAKATGLDLKTINALHTK